MKSIKYIVAALAVAALATASYATVTVNWSSAQVTYLADSGGNYVDGSDYIGVFSVAPTVGSSSLANFTALGTADSYTAGVLNSGNGFATWTGVAGANGHAQLYLVAVDQNGGEFIGYVSDASNVQWKLPADADTITSVGFDVQSFFANPGVDTSLAAGAAVVYGTTGLDSVTAGGPYNLLETVPEPSSIALVVIGLLGGVGMIRRRR
jgi:hypothetical protein